MQKRFFVTNIFYRVFEVFEASSQLFDENKDGGGGHRDAHDWGFRVRGLGRPGLRPG